MNRLLIVYDPFYPFSKGGGEHRMFKVAQGLIKRGYSVDWIGVKNWNDNEENNRFFKGINYIGLPMEEKSRSGDTDRRSLKSAISFSLKLFSYLRNKKYDIILTPQTPWLHIFVLLIRYKKRTPIILDLWEVWGSHWTEYYGPIIGRIGKIVEKLLVRLVDKTVVISNMTYSNALKLGINKDRLNLIHNGVDLSLVDDVKAHKNEYDIVYFGRLVPHKNVDYVVKTTYELVKKYPKIKVIIMGGGQEFIPLQKLVSKLDLEDNIKLTGKIEKLSDAFAILKSSKLFLLPTTSEGGGCIALLEANACGLPVIAIKHKQGIDPELIVEQENGFWVDSLDEFKMAEIISTYLNDKPLQEGMKEKSIDFVKEFDWNNISHQYYNLFETLRK